VGILNAGTNLTFFNEAGGQKKTLPTLHKSLNYARVQYRNEMKTHRSVERWWFLLHWFVSLNVGWVGMKTHRSVERG